MGCLDKVFNIGVTCLIFYQLYYNLGGAQELGGPYLEWHALAYSVGSLIPALLLGIHSTKLAFAKTDEERRQLASSCLHKGICYFYLTILGATLIFRVFMHFQWIHQLGPEHIVSYERSRKWLIYYYIVLQYTLAMTLTFTYLSKTRKINKGTTGQDSAAKGESSEAEQSRSAFDEPIIHYGQPMYLPTAMV